MSALFDFSSVLLILLLLICTCTYLRELRPSIFDTEKREEGVLPHLNRSGLHGFCWKLSRIGERLSPFVSISCLIMAVYVLFK